MNGSSCPNSSAPPKPPPRKKRVSAETQKEVKPAPLTIQKKKLSWSVANIEETITCDEVVVKVNLPISKSFLCFVLKKV